MRLRRFPFLLYYKVVSPDTILSMPLLTRVVVWDIGSGANNEEMRSIELPATILTNQVLHPRGGDGRSPRRPSRNPRARTVRPQGKEARLARFGPRPNRPARLRFVRRRQSAAGDRQPRTGTGRTAFAKLRAVRADRAAHYANYLADWGRYRRRSSRSLGRG